ncbi:hypothetical protein GCM10010372_77260 [Streptomyces tauricus]|nr:hypothetical protein GCM10010372_77260 [Streptomyces tauricus]
MNVDSRNGRVPAAPIGLVIRSASDAVDAADFRSVNEEWTRVLFVLTDEDGHLLGAILSPTSFSRAGMF